MVRRVQQGQQKLRKARRELTEKLESDKGEYRPPDRVECRYKVWETTGDDANTVRLQTHTWRRNSKLVDFVINAQVLTADGWETVEYVDCCHGLCHHHPQSATAPRQPIKRLDVVGDVQDAFSAAQELIYDRVRIIRG
jgi:hypothetical protein